MRSPLRPVAANARCIQAGPKGPRERALDLDGSEPGSVPGRRVVATYPGGASEVLLVRASAAAKRYLVWQVVLPPSLKSAVPGFREACLGAELREWE